VCAVLTIWKKSDTAAVAFIAALEVALSSGEPLTKQRLLASDPELLCPWGPIRYPDSRHT
jgi:hypothetical protein